MQNELLPQKSFTSVSRLTLASPDNGRAARATIAQFPSVLRRMPFTIRARTSLRAAAALSMTARLATAGALRFWRAYMKALHEARRREAALLLVQYCPDFDPAEFMRREYGIEPRQRRRGHGPLTDEEIAFLKRESKADD